jgi:hypothetical protein
MRALFCCVAAIASGCKAGPSVDDAARLQELEAQRAAAEAVVAGVPETAGGALVPTTEETAEVWLRVDLNDGGRTLEGTELPLRRLTEHELAAFEAGGARAIGDGHSTTNRHLRRVSDGADGLVKSSISWQVWYPAGAVVELDYHQVFPGSSVHIREAVPVLWHLDQTFPLPEGRELSVCFSASRGD